MNLVVEYTIDLVSSANKSGKLREKMARVKRHREAAYDHLFAASRNLRIKPTLPCCVTFTRMGHRLLDSHDNLKHSFKPTADSVAAFLGIKDNDTRVFWQYQQSIYSGTRILLKEQSIVRIDISDDVFFAECSVCRKKSLAISIRGKHTWRGLPEGWLQSGIATVCGKQCAMYSSLEM